jgi:hypothetical protein
VIERDVDGHAVILHTRLTVGPRTKTRQNPRLGTIPALGARRARTFSNALIRLWYFWNARATT